MYACMHAFSSLVCFGSGRISASVMVHSPGVRLVIQSFVRTRTGSDDYLMGQWGGLAQLDQQVFD